MQVTFIFKRMTSELKLYGAEMLQRIIKNELIKTETE